MSERPLRGGRGRTGEPYALLWRDPEDSAEWVRSEGEVGALALTSEITSLDELATLVMLV